MNMLSTTTASEIIRGSATGSSIRVSRLASLTVKSSAANDLEVYCGTINEPLRELLPTTLNAPGPELVRLSMVHCFMTPWPQRLNWLPRSVEYLFMHPRVDGQATSESVDFFDHTG